MIQKAGNIVLIDFPKKRWCHLVADSIYFLHKFAEEIGLKRHWFENKRGKNGPHYDVKGEMITKAIENGALQVQSREIINFLKEHYEKT